MNNRFRHGQRVRWNWGNGIGRGKIAERFDRHVERTIKGAKISRNGTDSNPAYLITQDDGGELLKLGSELTAI